MKVWTSVTRGHWLLACEYWMAANTFHGIGIRFENGYKSEELARILEFVMQHYATSELLRASPEPWPARIAANYNAHRRRERSGCDLSKRSHPRPRVLAHAACRRLTLTRYSLFFRVSEAAKRRSRCGSVRGRPVLSSHFPLAWRRTRDTALPARLSA